MFLGCLLTSAFLVAGCRTYPREESLVVNVLRVKGEARFAAEGKTWRPIRMRHAQHFVEHHVLQTAAKSFADIAWGELELPPLSPAGTLMAYKPKAQEKIIRITEDSLLRFDKLTARRLSRKSEQDEEKIELFLELGKVIVQLPRQVGDSSFEIRATNGVARVTSGHEISNTVFTFSTEGVLVVLVGRVTFAGIDNVLSREISGGYQFDARTGLVSPILEYPYHPHIVIHSEPVFFPDRWPPWPVRKF